MEGETGGENGNGANWSEEKHEQEVKRVIYSAGGGGEISKVEYGAGRWREMVQIGKEQMRWRERERERQDRRQEVLKEI